ncbi:MAG: lipopolysaccharide biosynthesis protein [Bacteroidales bacterium]|nr:lipopolysaccharide biosynthesis protein [Bacteroidales bacterium]
MNLKALAKDTAIYGLSSIVGRFLNYLLVPLYTYKIAAASGGYGIVTNLYAYSALLLALLTFGMETTFFRFAGKEGTDDKMVYSNALRMVGGVSLLFVALVFVFLRPIAGAMGYAAHPEYIGCFALIAGLDAFQAIMFGRLRQQHRPIKFMALKMTFIFVNIAMNLFIFLAMPKIPSLAGVYDQFNGGVGLIFFANLACTALVTLGFIPEIKGIFYGFDRKLCREMLAYSWPLLLLGLVGILNQVADKILFPYLMPGQEGQVQLGIYGACVKVAMIMSLITQAFRYAYEPIVFGGRDKNNPDTLAEGTKYFVLFTLLAWLAVMFYLPVVRYFIHPSYWEGLRVIPIVMMAEIFMGVYFNLSFWYKLTDKTWWGAIMSAIGVAVMVAVNVVFVPRIGYMACAWGGFAGYGVAMVLSFVIGQKYYPVAYDLLGMGKFLLFAAACYAVYLLIPDNDWLRMGVGTVMLAGFAALIFVDIRKRSITK